MKQAILIVDGYNVIGNWPTLNRLKQQDRFADARDQLLAVISQYAKVQALKAIVVFDAMFVPGIKQKYTQFEVEVVFTQQDQTADTYIEALADQLNQPTNQVTVVTSDQAEQWTIFSRGALRVSASDFYREIQRIQKEIQQTAKQFHNQKITRNQAFDTQQLQKLADLRERLSQKTSE